MTRIIVHTMYVHVHVMYLQCLGCERMYVSVCIKSLLAEDNNNTLHKLAQIYAGIQ